MAEVHDFKKDNEQSLEYEKYPWLIELVRELFPDMIELAPERNTENQKAGVDAWLVEEREGAIDGKADTGSKAAINCTKEHKVSAVDYKFRQRYVHDKKEDGFTDIALEIYSAEEVLSPGWAIKENAKTDYIFYVFLPSKALYVLDFKKLQEVMNDLRHDWYRKATLREDGFTWIYSKNRSGNGLTYTSKNLVVPVKLLCDLGVVLDLRITGPLYEGGPTRNLRKKNNYNQSSLLRNEAA